MVGLCDDTAVNAALSYGAGPRTLQLAWSTDAEHADHTTSFAARCASAGECYVKPPVAEACTCSPTEDLKTPASQCSAAVEFATDAGAWTNAKCEYSGSTCRAKNAGDCATTPPLDAAGCGSAGDCRWSNCLSVCEVDGIADEDSCTAAGAGCAWSAGACAPSESGDAAACAAVVSASCVGSDGVVDASVTVEAACVAAAGYSWDVENLCAAAAGGRCTYAQTSSGVACRSEYAQGCAAYSSVEPEMVCERKMDDCTYTAPAPEACVAVHAQACESESSEGDCEALSGCSYAAGACTADDATLCAAVPADGSSGYGDDSVLREQTFQTFLSRSSLKNEAVITLGRADLTPGQSYSFTVNVTNMLGLSDATTVTVQKTAASIPNVRAKAPHVRSSRGEDIILSSFATLPESKEGCTIPKHWTLIDYAWSVELAAARAPSCGDEAGGLVSLLCAPARPADDTYCSSPCAEAARYHLRHCPASAAGLREDWEARVGACPAQQAAAADAPLELDPVTRNQKDLFV